MKLIKELTEEVEYITEADEASGKKNNYIRGIFLVGEQKNKNGRIYPISTLEKEAERYVKR